MILSILKCFCEVLKMIYINSHTHTYIALHTFNTKMS